MSHLMIQIGTKLILIAQGTYLKIHKLLGYINSEKYSIIAKN